MVRSRAALVPIVFLALLVGVALPVAADLTIDTQQTGTALDIYADGAATLSAPQNTTIQAFHNGYFIDWTAPALQPGQQIAGYTLYRVPGPSTGGNVQVTHLAVGQTAAYNAPGAGTYVYFVTAVLQGMGAPESIPGAPVSTSDVGTNYPHCNVVGVYTAPPYYDTHIGCLFPLP